MTEERELVEVMRKSRFANVMADMLVAEAANLIERIAKERDEAREWQPIETAPKDGTVVLIWGGTIDVLRVDALDDESLDVRPVTAWWSHEVDWGDGTRCCWRYCSYDSGIYGEYGNPTHWLPIPAPPKAPTP